MVVDRVQRLELSESGVHESFLLEGNNVGKPARFATLGRSDCESGPATPSTQELMFCVRSVVRCPLSVAVAVSVTLGSGRGSE